MDASDQRNSLLHANEANAIELSAMGRVFRIRKCCRYYTLRDVCSYLVECRVVTAQRKLYQLMAKDVILLTEAH